MLVRKRIRNSDQRIRMRIRDAQKHTDLRIRTWNTGTFFKDNTRILRILIRIPITGTKKFNDAKHLSNNRKQLSKYW
jgi:hypothetical protein